MPDTFNPYQAWLGLSESLVDPNHYELLAIKMFEPDSNLITQAADLAFAKVRNALRKDVALITSCTSYSGQSPSIKFGVPEELNL